MGNLSAVTCVIVGAGMAGLTAAALLRDAGWQIIVLDKGRGVGGRMATRRIGEHQLDHGAQFFTVRDERFRCAVERWEQAGWVQPWFTHQGHTRYRATGGMSGLAKQLAAGLDVRVSAKVERLSCADGSWAVMTDVAGVFAAKALLLTPPAEQTLALLPAGAFPSWWTGLVEAIEFDPCFALLLTGTGESLVPEPGFARCEAGPVAWVADNVQKGISPRAEGFALTLHASAEFSRLHFDRPKEEVAEMLLPTARQFFRGEIREQQVHRWKYSQPVATTGEKFLYSATPAPLAIAGDAFGGPRVEGAFLSGIAAAERMLAGH